MLKDKNNIVFIVLACFFITNAIVAEFIGVKIFSLESSLGFDPINITLFGTSGLNLNLTAGVVLWPVVFVMTDIINEYYGLKGVKFLTNITILLILYAFIMVYIAMYLTPNNWWQYESGKSIGIADMGLVFNKIFGQGLWIIVGSIIAFLIGQITDVHIFQYIKRKTGEQKIWLRATGSTMISQFIDSFVVLFIAFYIGADWELNYVLAIALVNYIYKFIMAILLTPIIYLFHIVIDKYLGLSLSIKMKQEAMNK